MNIKLNQRFGKLLLELTLIVVGALLALGFTEWQEDRERERLARDLMVNIQAELVTNMETLTSLLPYHQAMYARMGELLVQLDQTDTWTFPPDDYRGVEAAKLLSSAQDAAIVAQVFPTFGADTIQSLSQVGALISEYRRNQSTFGLATLQTDFGDGERYLRLLQFWFDDLVRSESELLEAIEQALENIEQYLEA